MAHGTTAAGWTLADRLRADAGTGRVAAREVTRTPRMTGESAGAYLTAADPGDCAADLTASVGPPAADERIFARPAVTELT